MKKKVLFIHHSSIIGGASWCLFEILRHLDRNRFDPVVLLRSEGPLSDRIRTLDITVEVNASIPVFPFYARGQIRGMIYLLRALLHYPAGFGEFCACCRRIAPDALYLNSSAQLFLPWPAKKAGVKRVVLHNREHWDPQGILKIKRMISRWIIRRYVDEVFSITECGLRALGLPGKGVAVRDWPSFDDQTGLDIRAELGISPDTFLILLTGGLLAIKGTLDALKALNLMQMKDRAVIVVIGCSPEGASRWKQTARRLLRRVSYANRITRLASDFPERVFLLPPTLQVKAYIQQCDVLVAPFTMPHAAKAALEAQSLGRPVVLYDSEEAREYVRHGRTGLLVPHGDVQGLADAMDDLIFHPEKAARLGAAGIEFVRDQFSASDSMKKISAAFEKAC